MSETLDRVLVLEGIHNLRDYGGYRTPGGGRIARGRLFRSGQHVDASDADLDIFHALGIDTIVDLRGDGERQTFPCRRHREFAGEVIYAPGESVNPAGPLEGSPSVDEAFERLRLSYEGMPLRPVLQQGLANYFAALADTGNASLVHCLAGKDRTGLAVALFHLLLGVSRDDVMEDYLLTNTAGRSEARIAAVAEVIRGNFGRDISDETIAMVMSVQPEFLETALATIEAEFGSVEAYAEQALGVSPALRQRLVENYVA